MKTNEKTLLEILHNLDDGVYFVDRERRITYWNKGAERISGFGSNAVQGRFCHDNILNHVTENGKQLCFDGCPLHATIKDGRPRQAEVFLHHSDGHRVPILVRTKAIRDEDGKITGAVEIFSDNSKLFTIRHRVRRLQDAAFHDHLTGLWNRRYLEQRLQTAVWEYEKNQTMYGILFLDIDHFKSINDKYGHKIGDQVLIAVSNTLKQNLRAEDIVARWGGEEFIVAMRGPNQTDLAKSAAKLSALVKNSGIRIKDDTIHVSISIGMTLIRAGDQIQSLVDRADQNMYRSKKTGLPAGDEEEATGKALDHET
jgi:diguanylate cyclase (GGDEF)-like protein/PAS domain S-box-containing protein